MKKSTWKSLEYELTVTADGGFGFTTKYNNETLIELKKYIEELIEYIKKMKNKKKNKVKVI